MTATAETWQATINYQTTLPAGPGWHPSHLDAETVARAKATGEGHVVAELDHWVYELGRIEARTNAAGVAETRQSSRPIARETTTWRLTARGWKIVS